MSLKVGKANYTKTNTVKYFSIGKDPSKRELVVRIAPPVKELADKGKISEFTCQHFGYGTTGPDGKRKYLSFGCIQRLDRHKNVLQDCPECTEIALRKAKLESEKEKLISQQVDPAVIEAKLKPQEEWCRFHYASRKNHYYAKNEAGEWGILSLAFQEHQALATTLENLAKEGDDPTDPENGIWVKISRISDKPVQATVEPVKVSHGKGMFGYKTDSLTEKDFQAIDGLPSLTSLSRRLTYEQIACLVESGGDESVVSSVFDSASPRREASAARTPAPVQEVRQPAPAAPVAKPAPAPQVAPVSISTREEDELQAHMAAMQAQLSALRKAKTEPAPQPQAQVTKKLDMDPDAFLAQFGSPDEQ